MLCYKKNKEELTDEQVMAEYEKIIAVLDNNITNGVKVTSNQQYKDKVDKAFSSCVKVDCDYIANKLAPKFKAYPTNLALAKKLFGMVSSQKCDKNDLYFQAAELIVEKEPSCGGAMTIARNAKKAKKYETAIKFFNNALELCNGQNSAEIYYEMADIYVRKGQKENARDHARKSIAAGESHQSKSYVLIGNLYFKGAKDCDPQSVVLFRTRYIAAYEQFKLAGSTSNMERAKAQFPSASDIFDENKTLGDSMNTGCWINETITIQKR